jgi:hypothetical protein
MPRTLWSWKSFDDAVLPSCCPSTSPCITMPRQGPVPKGIIWLSRSIGSAIAEQRLRGIGTQSISVTMSALRARELERAAKGISSKSLDASLSRVNAMLLASSG